MVTCFVSQLFGISDSAAAVLLWCVFACFWGQAFSYIGDPRKRACFSLVMGMTGTCYCFGLTALLATAFPAVLVYYLAERYRTYPRFGPLVTAGMLVYCFPLFVLT